MALLSLLQQPYGKKRSRSSHMKGSRMRTNKPGLETPVMNGKVILPPSVVHSLARDWLRLKGSA